MAMIFLSNRLISPLAGFTLNLKRLWTILLTMLVCLAIALTSFPRMSIAAPAVSAVETSPVVDVADIAAEKIDQFAQAYLQVLTLLSDRESEIPAAETTAEALKIEQSIESAAVQIIQDSGLTMPEYMQILGLASQDATFQDKVLGRLDEVDADE
ncbi:MAG: DUF4168 domain-containing protein [Phormidesmis sp.]